MAGFTIKRIEPHISIRRHHRHHHHPYHHRHHHSRYSIVATPVVYQLGWKISLIIFSILTFIIGLTYLILFLTKSGPFDKNKNNQTPEPTRRPRIVSFNT